MTRKPIHALSKATTHGTATRAKGDNEILIACAMLRHAGLPMMSPYYARIYEGIEEEVAAHRCKMLFTSIPHTALWTSDRRLRVTPLIPHINRFRGALLIGGLTDDLALAYKKQNIAVVLVDKPSTADLSSVMPDNFNAGSQAAKYLLSLGHRRIAFLAAPPDPVVNARHDGFVAALRKAGLSFDPEDYIPGGYQTRTAAAAMTEYLNEQKRHLPSAILAINDEAALGVLQALRARRIAVPGRISVMGFDDISPAAAARPALTTMHIPLQKMGRLAAQTLFAHLEGASEPVSIQLETKLVVRESCAKPSRPARHR